MATNIQKLLVLLIYLLVLAPNLAVSVPCDVDDLENESCTQFGYFDGHIVAEPKAPMVNHIFVYPKVDPVDSKIKLWIKDSSGQPASAVGSVIVLDHLGSTSGTAALSANQGRILNEKAVKNASDIASNTTAIGDIKTDITIIEDDIDTIHVDIDGLENEIATIPQVQVIDALNSTSTTSALSANQGRVLNITKGDVFGPSTAPALAPLKIHPFMTSNTAPAGYIVTGTPAGFGDTFYYAFDGVTYSDWFVGTGVGAVEVKLQIPAPKSIKSYRVYPNTNYGSLNWTLSGSTNGTTWTVIDSQVNALRPGPNTYNLATATPPYTYFKMHNLSNGYGDGDVYELELYEEAMATPTIINKYAVFADSTGKLLKTADPAGITGPLPSTNNALAVWSGTNGKFLQDSSIIYSPSRLGLTLPAGSYIEIPGDSLMSYFTWNGLGWGKNQFQFSLAPSNALSANYRLTFPSAPPVDNQVLRSDATGQLSWIAMGTGSGDVVGPAGGTTANQVALFNSVSGKLIKNTPYTIPAVDGTVNQILKTNGAGVVSWATDAGGGTGDVVGPASSTTNTIPTFSSSTGKALSGSSTITIVNGNDLVLNNGRLFVSGNAALYSNSLVLKESGAGNNYLYLVTPTDITSDYTIKFPTAGPLAANQILQSDASGNLSWIATPASGAATVVIDALNSTSTTAALSANQGKVLNDTKVTTTVTTNNAGELAVFTATSKLIQSSGISQTYVVTKPFDWTSNNRVALGVAGGRSLAESNWTVPQTVCPSGQVLKSDGTNMVCNTDATGTPTIVVDALNSTSTTSALSANQGRVLNEKVPLTTWAAGQAYKVGEIKNSGDNNNWLFKVTQDHTSTNVPADFKAGKILAISPPIITTGLQDGGQATLNAPTRVATVQAGTGYIALYGPAPTAFPQITIVEWPLQTITLPNSPPNIFTLFINSSGVLEYVSGTGATTQAEQDTKISVGIVDMNLGVAYDRETYPTNPVGQLRGLSFFFGGMTRGLSYSAVPATPLTMARTAHDVYYWGANTSDQYNPNTKSMLAISPVPFFEYYKGGPVVPTTRKTVFNTSVWDDGTNDLAVLSNNKWGFVRIYSAPGVDDYIMYAQAEYADEASAKAAAISTNFIKPVDLTLTKFSAWFVFQKDDLDLTNNLVTVCEPFGCDKIGTSAGGVAGGGGTGDVLGPTGSTVNHIALFGDASGKIIKDDSPVSIDSSGYILSKNDGAHLQISFANDSAYMDIYQTVIDWKRPNGNFFSIKPPATPVSSYSLTFPNAAPSANQILQAQSGGQLSWINTPSGAAATIVVDALNSTSTTAALSANQGMILDGKITTLTTASHSHTNKTLLDSLISNGAATSFLAADGTYKTPVDTNSITVVEDLLTSVSAVNALSANQGRILKGLVDTNTSNIATQGTSITALQGTSHSHTNKATLDVVKNNGTTAEFLSGAGTYVTPSIPAAVTVVDNLTSTSTTSALSANQGKVLNDTKVTGPASSTDNYIARFNGTTGKLIKGGSVGTLDNNGYLSIVGITPILKLDDGTSSGWYSQNQIRFYNANGNTFDLKPPLTTSSNYSIRFPNNPPTINQLLQSDASGNLSWINTPTASTATGDVSSTGASSTDGAIPLYSGTGGKTIKYDSSLLYSGGNIYLGGSGIGTAGFVLRGGTSGQIIFKGAATTPGYTLTLPSAAPAATQILQSDGSGNLSWIPTPTASTATGDVAGPASSEDGSVAMFSGTGGKTLKTYSGFTYATGYLTLGPAAGGMNGVKFNSGGVGTVTLASSGSNNSNYTLNLPTSAPGTNQILLAQNTGQLSWVALPVDTNTVTTVVDNLTSSSTTSALSANQGRLLDARVTTNATNIATNVTDINALEANAHTHTNKTLLDSLVSNGAGTAYLANDGTYKVIAAATGDVVGPGSSVDNQIALFSGTGGKTIKPSGATLDSSGNLAIPGKATVTGQILSTQPAVKSDLIFDFNNGNNQVSSGNCGSVQLNNTVDGGVYSIVLTGATSAQCSFSGTPTFTVHLPVGHGSTVGSKHTLFTFTRLNGHMYIGWNPGL